MIGSVKDTGKFYGLQTDEEEEHRQKDDKAKEKKSSKGTQQSRDVVEETARRHIFRKSVIRGEETAIELAVRRDGR